jgi:hypothetical protein
MCETSAEVLGGLKKAVRNYEGIQPERAATASSSRR